jgi:histidine kinase
LIALVALVAYLGLRAQEQNSIARTLQSGNWFSDTVKRATRYAMLKDQRESVHATIEAMGQQEGVEVIRVFNKKGRVMFSTRRSEIGDLVDMHAEACYACHSQDQPPARLPLTQRSRIYSSRPQANTLTHRVLGVINPIHTEPACYTDPCHVHPPDQTVLGVLDVSLSLNKVDQEVAATTRQFTVVTTVLVLVISGILIAFTLHFVNRPLTALLDATRQIASGDYEHVVTAQTDDEIGALAQSFEDMRQGIKEKADLLEETRRQYQGLFEQVPCHITVQDRNFRLVAFNKKFERDFGGQLGDFCYQAYKGRASKCPSCSVERTFQDGQVHSAEETVLGKDGQSIFILNLTAPLRDKHGNIEAVMEMATDITPVRLLEGELLKSEEKYRLFFNNDPIPMLVLDQETLEIMDVNDRAAAEYRNSKEALIGRPFLSLTSLAEQARVSQFLEARDTLLPRVLQCRADGQPFYVNMRASYGEHMGRRAIITTTADITAMVETEQNLIQAAKMATLGEMSAGVAHELNQPLSIMATAGNFLAKQADRGLCPSQDLLKEVSGELLSQVERAKRIINHLREFGRKARVDRVKVSLGTPIQGVFHLLGQQLRLHDISVSCELPEDLAPIWGDVNRLEQVFINLVLNARDAIEKRRGEEGPLEGLIVIKAWNDREMVRVQVSDNGSGIPVQQQGRIFEPFFTTKEVGKGTGLGLSISYGIVRDYGGVIDVTSQPGQGTTFRVSFPVAKEEVA